ncbi:hypothetical protein PHAVU_005G110200 [Phaseolus vulgaris]|uniref:Uncharacterized protein n=1 Tax=Phaseolus vulgaris TaxID=3885 RepID=V7BVD3_PHAVU|nr:hypothetical protein PHAVU_005G110200g [Phaseolus vulgaris]ESW21914.1 hypothetical protein PHAVU_005G110200g [Phaseolus vulgaris]
MKNASKKKFLTCFRPVDDTDPMLQPRAVVDRSSSRRLACTPVADKHDTRNSATKSTFSEQELPQNLVVPHPPKPSFSKVIKAMLIETVLNTRARKKNLNSQTCFGSKRGYWPYTESSSTGDEKQVFVDSKIQKIIKPPEWSPTISSSNSPVSESKKISEFDKEQEQKQKKFQCVGIYWVFVSLVVTVFWGKINVIIWTSLLLCFFSLWNASCCWPEEVPKLRSVESKAYKNSRRDRSGRSNRNKERS